MGCRTFFSRNLPLGGCLLILIHSLSAETDLAATHTAATKRQDWSTAAETAIRWLESDPSQTALMGSIADARLRQDDLEACEKWLSRWEESTSAPTSPMLALRGELERARGDSAKAHSLWRASYEASPSETVARRLTDGSLWSDNDRKAYETFMIRLAKDYQFTSALTVAAEADVRDRQWEACQKRIDTLNEMGTQSAMRVAALFESVLKKRPLISQHDQAIAQDPSGLAYARRAGAFRELRLLQLAIEDSRKSLSLAPRMALPRITLALCLAARGQDKELSQLRVVVKDQRALITEKQRLALDKLDHAVSESVVEPKVFLQRALALAGCRQPFLALDDLILAGPVLQDSAEGWTCRGHCLVAQNHLTEAEQAFETALEKDPAYIDAWDALSNIAWDRADYPEAIKRLTWLAEHNPNNPKYPKRLALAQIRLR